jgi:hypothetical protein
MSPTPSDLSADPQEPSPVPSARLATRPVRWLRAVAAATAAAGVTAADTLTELLRNPCRQPSVSRPRGIY